MAPLCCSGLTHIAWGPTSGGHDSILLHLGQTKVSDHDLGVLLRGEVQQQSLKHIYEPTRLGMIS